MLVTWVSRKGGRIENEDAVGKIKAKNILCAVVADGLGGHLGGKLASNTAVEAILGSFSQNPEFSPEAVKTYIQSGSAAIAEIAKNDPDYVHMSSTVAVILIKGGKAIYANVGDSRIYRFRDDRLIEVSEDHSVAFTDFLNGNIEYDDIRTSKNQNKLTSALGMGLNDINVSEIIPVDSHTSFLLCTDGWWEYVTEEEMENTSAASVSSREWISAMLEIREAKAPENSDNYTAAAIML